MQFNNPELGGAPPTPAGESKIVRHPVTRSYSRYIHINPQPEIDPIIEYDFRGVFNEIKEQTHVNFDKLGKEEEAARIYHELLEAGLTEFKKNSREDAQLATALLAISYENVEIDQGLNALITFNDVNPLFCEWDEEKIKNAVKGLWLLQRNYLRKNNYHVQLFYDNYKYKVYNKYRWLEAFQERLYPNFFVDKRITSLSSIVLEGDKRWELIKAILYAAYIKKGSEIILKLDRYYRDNDKRSYNYFFLACVLYSLDWCQEEMMIEWRPPFLKNENKVCNAFGISPKRLRGLFCDCLLADKHVKLNY